MIILKPNSYITGEETVVMTTSRFHWFGEDLEIDVGEFVSSPGRTSSVNRIVDAVGNMFYYVLAFSLAARLCTYVFGFNVTLLEMKLNVLLLSMIVVSTLFLTLAVIRRIVTFVMSLGFVENVELYTKLHKLVMVSTWFGCCIYWFKFVKVKYDYDFELVHKILVSGMISCISYSITTIIIIYFEGFFLKNALKDKLDDVQKSERIVRAMKNYRYEISESTETTTPECTCMDLLCFRTASRPSDNILERRGEEGFHSFTGGLQINPPELHGIVDAKTLARDVFHKASGNSDVLSFDDFGTIFPSTQDALNAFSFFDSSDTRTISKKEFHDTIVYFYMERVNLEKGIMRAGDFVDVVANTLDISVFVILCFTYLIIFGIPLKELLALALSSALALNFVASGMATDVYYNFMMLISHQFDIGDDLIVDGVDYRVYEFGLTNTSLIGENGGKIKLLNSDLWKKKVVNMTRAPEKIIVFDFDLDPNIKMEDFGAFKARVHEFVNSKTFDYENSFSIQARTDSFRSIDILRCTMILKCKNYKNKAKKFVLRVEMTSFLRSLITEMNIGAK